MLQKVQLWKKVKTNLQSRFSNLKATFDSIDQNKNGSIDLEELTIELKANHGITSNSQITSIFNLLNSSKSQEITREEFEQLWMSDETQQCNDDKELQPIKTYLQPHQSSILQKSGSSQQFSNLFDSYKSNNSPTKYINIQGDFTINQFNTPPLLDRTASPPKVISPPKPDQYPKSKLEVKDDKFREMQRQISNLFTCKTEQPNTTPFLKQNFDGFLHTVKLGGSKKSSVNTSAKTKSPFLSNHISLQNYAFQFNDMKMQFNSKYNGERTNNNMKNFIYNKK
ncbi:unnamed protein product (macronuclear) [Paramecium tetraurelia]|uniref:EF-hand domain-containing protein n=1 Tax=Paramecium tetraurelia TaxID=5888 RepID=A0CYW8_PARTE|nr:uncharacterized protein GSPATT00011586001 [Paramecium tetraurelia]CAK75985.1 unnamed protein product [Paramecium tetraurelia]|eukprot:XP_001443382.1 hypothetical protein (macronuclear) [Paramecium tetraurelia strain d4-2]